MKSPCIAICRLENDKCVGCLRTREEITNWLKYSDEEREAKMKEIAERKHA